MGLDISRSLLGYRVRATVALFRSLEREIEMARAARAEELDAVTRRLEEAQVSVRAVEAQVAAIQEEQRVLLATMEAYAGRGEEILDRVRQELAKEEAAVLAEITRREAILGQRRALVRRFRESVAAAVESVLQELAPSADGGGEWRPKAATGRQADGDDPRRAGMGE